VTDRQNQLLTIMTPRVGAATEINNASKYTVVMATSAIIFISTYLHFHVKMVARRTSGISEASFKYTVLRFMLLLNLDNDQGLKNHIFF